MILDGLSAEGALLFRGCLGDMGFKTHLAFILLSQQVFRQFRHGSARWTDKGERSAVVCLIGCRLNGVSGGGVGHNRLFLKSEFLFAFRTFHFHSDPFFLHVQGRTAMRTFRFKFCHRSSPQNIYAIQSIFFIFILFNVTDPNKYFPVFKKNSKNFLVG